MRPAVLRRTGVTRLAGAALLVLLAVAAHAWREGGRQPQRPVWIFYDSTRTSAQQVSRAVREAKGTVRYVSSWLTAVSADLPAARARQLPGVIHVQQVGYVYAQGRTASGARHAAPLFWQQDSTSYGPNYSALREMGVPQAHVLGFTGRTRVAIIDTGFEPAHEAFAGARIVAQRDFIGNDNVVSTEPGDPQRPRDQEMHGTWVWSVLGGNKAGQIIGPAYGAEFILAKVDIEQNGDDFAADEERWVAAVEWADSNRARVINSSLAFKNFIDKPDYTPQDMDGDIAISTRMADQAARRGIVLVNAIGNTPGSAGPGSLFAPADADSIIAVGAIDAVGQLWANSARGPTADNRDKPELVARGVNVHAASARSLSTYDQVSGTSLAAPFVAGLAALMIEAWPNLNPMGVRQALLQSASNAAFPDNARGHGVPNVASAIVFPEGLDTRGVETVDLVTNTLTTISPIFRWRAASVHPRVQPRYRLELATDPQFNTILYSDTVTNAFSLGLRQPLRPRNAIWWRVVAEVNLGGSTIRRSTAVAPPIAMPDWVTLTTLNDPGPQFVNSTRPTFEWQSRAAEAPLGPLVFDLQIINNQSGAIVQNLRNLTSSTVTLTDPLTPNLSYRWRVIARSQVAVTDTVDSRSTFVVTSSSQPPSTALYPSFPNPFPRPGQSVTHFWFDLTQPSTVELTIHDLRGRLIRRLIPNGAGCSAQLPSGQYGRGEQTDPCIVTEWDGRNQSGETVPRGVYIARLRANAVVSTQRILFLPE